MTAEHDRPGLAQVFGTLARELETEHGLEHTLERISRAAVATVPGATHAGISVVERHNKITARAPTHDIVRQCDEWQRELNEGPCLEAIWEQHTVVAQNLATDTRWPRFAARAVEHGLCSLISFQLFVEDDNLGALNLYASTEGPFDDDARLIGELFATHAAVALAGAFRTAQFTEALATRDAIGQAKGLLMARENLTGEQAFHRLVRASQETNIKLAEVARWLITEHEKSPHDHHPRAPEHT